MDYENVATSPVTWQLLAYLGQGFSRSSSSIAYITSMHLARA